MSVTTNREVGRNRQSDAKKPTAKLSAKTSSVCEEAIRTLAYKKWEEAGKPEGDGVSFWIEAEEELSQ